MKLVFLTTQTPHHTFFIKEILNHHEISGVIVETAIYAPSFEIQHEFESVREDYERNCFFGGESKTIQDFVEPVFVASVNDKKTIKYIESIEPDAIVVFGTGLLKKDIINTCPNGIINLHGGDPERYRGLDSHLWSIYHDDFSSIVCTLHRVNEALDDGEIVLQMPVAIHRDMQLFELRRFNTENCVMLVLAALDMFGRFGRFISHPQRRKGRYYSFMPSPLKDICVKKFNSYTERL